MSELLRQGGPMLGLILLVGLGAAAIFLERLYYLHRAQIKWRDFLLGIFNILKRQNIAEAVSICEETPGPVAQLARAAILHHDEGPVRIRRAMEETGLVEMPRLESRLPLLATLAHLSPLLGLLGTVLGLMRMLLMIQQKAPLVHAGDLSAGLWQALLATAAGLAVSIPAYAGYNLLLARVASVSLDMERAAMELENYFAQNPPASGAV